MSELFKILSILSQIFGQTSQVNHIVKKEKPVCERNVDHLDYRTKIEILIGCSEVDGKKVYSKSKLERLYKNEA